jgi:hypothetical protein
MKGKEEVPALLEWKKTAKEGQKVDGKCEEIMHKRFVLLMTSQIGIHEAGTGSSAHISNSVLGNSISVIVRLCLPFQFPCLLRSRISQYRRHYVASRMSIFRFLRWPVIKSFAFENTLCFVRHRRYCCNI